MKLKRNKQSEQGWACDESTPTKERPIRQSIRSTYDSRETGPRFHVTYMVNDKTITFQQPIEDPFVHGTVRINRRDLFKGWLRGRLEVSMHVSGDRDIKDDVLELDENQLISNSTRAQTFRSHINERLGESI
jgi:hypothetical protein